MSSQQPSLFGAPNAYNVYEPPLARATDPATSHRAAARQRASGKINSGAAVILDILRRAARPLTYREIFSLATDDEKAKLREPNTVAKRLTVLDRRDLVRAGPERICTVGGNEARVWECLEAPEAAS